jgi:hypothetical protein
LHLDICPIGSFLEKYVVLHITAAAADVVADVEIDPSITIVIDERRNQAMAVDLRSCWAAQQIGHSRER